MGKLDEILYESACSGYLCTHETADDHYLIDKETKQQIKNLFLDLIGKQLEYTKAENDGKCEDMGINISSYVKGARNSERRRLRQKVEEL